MAKDTKETVVTRGYIKGNKLAIIMSRKSPYAVILRRGPSKWYHVMKWDFRNDIIEHGAWFKGRIYENKCDLSDDGNLFLYSVSQWSRLQTSYTDSYTALSKAPWLKAYALWPQGSTYLGGGEFISENKIGIWTLPFMKEMHPDHTNTLGYSFVNLTKSDGWHDDCQLVTEAEWSKKDTNDRIIWYKGYDIYIRVNSEDRLFLNLKDLEPGTNLRTGSAPRSWREDWR